ncbi:ankyrin repeat-containing domain protein [Pyronema domesticum]|uniref:Similar to Ankyrin repeat domain-containing protein 50 acc. no. Q9ULJ7 n=1 Tax=Pyronema omphalodes (strain CBS 100304) TaxID=1076935 RepID=U4LBC5_PYROM|nr:ankyrin repeat-containing domain protein [Pyronema domesticum]CCX07593.1 Similar to Ankyrin repeat domain-containing protein 50; acc. no. Q9ULJ7 [Pyronema omphalodes CBS 100304]
MDDSKMQSPKYSKDYEKILDRWVVEVLLADSNIDEKSTVFEDFQDQEPSPFSTARAAPIPRRLNRSWRHSILGGLRKLIPEHPFTFPRFRRQKRILYGPVSLGPGTTPLQPPSPPQPILPPQPITPSDDYEDPYTFAILKLYQDNLIIRACLGDYKPSILRYLDEDRVPIHPIHLNTILVYACQRGHLDIVELLLSQNGEKGHRHYSSINLDACDYVNDSRGTTPLVAACLRSQKDIVQALLKSGVGVNVPNGRGKTALMTACEHGYQDIVSLLLLQPGIDVNARSFKGRTALIAAAKRCQWKTTGLLLDSVENLELDAADTTGKTALIWACIMRQLGIISLLLDHGTRVDASDNSGTTGLLWACKLNWGDVVSLLLERGADVNATDFEGRTGLMQSSIRGYISIMRLLLQSPGIEIEKKDDNSWTAFFYACATRPSTWRQETIEVLIEAGADVNAKDWYGRTALMWCLSARRDREGSIKYLAGLEAVDINSPDYGGTTPFIRACQKGKRSLISCLTIREDLDFNAVDASGKTALMYAVDLHSTLNHLSILGLLIMGKKFDLNIQDNQGKTALMYSCNRQHFITKLFFDHGDSGIDVNLKDAEGKTALIWACSNGDWSTRAWSAREVLRKEDVDINVRDKHGKTALMYAKEQNQTMVVELLKGWGALDNDEVVSVQEQSEHRMGSWTSGMRMVLRRRRRGD